MATLKVNKPESARRQIDAAVRMLFNGGDAVACATLAGAAYRIVRDLAEQTGKSQTHNALTSIILPGMEKEFWSVMNSVPNFLKHADKDPQAILEIDDEWIDLTLFHASLIYRDLGFQLTPEMNVLGMLVVADHPKFLKVSAEQQHVIRDAHLQIAGLTRAQKLEVGRRLLIPQDRQ